MSEEAKSRSGQIIGSGAYFAALHQSRLMAEVLPDPYGYDYSEGISALAKRAKEALTSIYGDLCTHQEILRYIPEDRRSQLGHLVRELDAICQSDGGYDSTAASCQGLLAAAAFSGRSMATEHEMSTAEQLLSGGGESGLTVFERITALQEARLGNDVCCWRQCGKGSLFGRT